MSTQTVIEGILSQKVVQSGSGYAVKTDIKNIDTVNCNILQANTINLNTGTISSIDQNISVDIPNLTSQGIVMVNPANANAGKIFADGSGIYFNFYVTTSTGYFTIHTSSTGTSKMFNYFVAKY